LLSSFIAPHLGRTRRQRFGKNVPLRYN